MFNIILTIFLIIAAIWIAAIIIGYIAVGIWALIRLPIEIFEFFFKKY